MLHRLLPAWRGRRTLLAGSDDPFTRTMYALLEEIGARPACISPGCDSETLCRTLLSGRGTVIIVPDLNAYGALPLGEQLPALCNLLCEAREAGTPLVILLADHAAQAHSLDALMRYADEFSRGEHGDAISIQAIWHEGLSVHEACIRALTLGARYLLGDLSCTGIFSL